MTLANLTLCSETLHTRASGALYWPARACLVVSDLHLGRSERYARRGGALLPPYEVDETLTRLEADIAEEECRLVICLGDSFDDTEAAELSEGHALWLARMMAGRRWIWIAGNHDPGPIGLGGACLSEHSDGPLVFRHIARAGAAGEISGHYHPKARIAGRSYPCFLADESRIVLPAYGAFTGGLSCDDPSLSGLMRPDAVAVLTGRAVRTIPMPRRKDNA